MLLSNLRVAWPFFIWDEDPYKKARKRADSRAKLQENLESDLHLFVETDKSIGFESRINARRKNRKPRENLDP